MPREEKPKKEGGAVSRSSKKTYCAFILLGRGSPPMSKNLLHDLIAPIPVHAALHKYGRTVLHRDIYFLRYSTRNISILPYGADRRGIAGWLTSSTAIHFRSNCSAFAFS